MKNRFYLFVCLIIIICISGCSEKNTINQGNATTQISVEATTYEIEGIEFDFDPYTEDETVCNLMEAGNFVRIDNKEKSMQNAVKEEYWEDVNTKETIFIHWLNDGEVVVEITTIGVYQN